MEKIYIEDLQFIRSMIAKTHREIDPGISMFIAWGILFMVGYIGTHILIAENATRLINSMWFTIYAIGFPLSAFLIYRLIKRQKNEGIVSNIYIQICQLWCILGTIGIVWINFGLGKNFLGDISFVWAWILAVGLCMMGIIHLRLWLISGLGVFIGIAVAVFVPDYQFIVLGTTLGIGFIVPAVVIYLRLRGLNTNDQR